MFIHRTSDDAIRCITRGLDNTNIVDDKMEVHIKADEISFFKDTFLDSDYSIKEDIHERFKRYCILFFSLAY